MILKSGPFSIYIRVAVNFLQYVAVAVIILSGKDWIGGGGRLPPKNDGVLF